MKSVTVFILLLGLFLASVASAQGGRNMGHGRNNSGFAGRQGNIQNNFQPRPFNNPINNPINHNVNWPTTNQPVFDMFDQNNDGLISESEFADARNDRISSRAQDGYLMQNIATSVNFADLDINSDGQISIEEFATHQGQNQVLNRNPGPRRGGSR